MRAMSLLFVIMLWCGSSFAQQSVMLEDLTTTEIQAAIAKGKTTAFLYVGGVHENQITPEGSAEDAVATGKHNFVGNYIARRVAEDLGNALAVMFPHSPQGDPVKKTVHMRFAGTMTLTDETFERACRDIAMSLIAAGFKNVFIAGDHGLTGQNLMKKVAAELDSEWSSKGVHVSFIPVYDEAKIQMREYLTKLNVPDKRQVPLEDAAEVLAVNKENRWVRKEKLPPEIAKLASPEVGKVLVDQKINIAVKYIRSHVANTVGDTKR